MLASARFNQVVFGLLIWIALAQTAFQSAPNIRNLMANLSDPRTTSSALARDILVVAKKDASARDYVAQRLPDLIDGPDGDVWVNAVQLAGKMRATEAIPSLQKAMSRPPFPAQRDVGLSTPSLQLDIVARALYQMGDRAVPSVVDLLKSGDELMRNRCVNILIDLNTPASRKALREWLPHETATSVRGLIQTAPHQ
jgi:HEAT repeat protein